MKAETRDLIIIKTSAKYKISQDVHQFILSKARKGEEVWDTVGYYHTLNDIFTKLVTINLLDKVEKRNLHQVVEDTCSKLEHAVTKALQIAVLKPVDGDRSNDL